MDTKEEIHWKILAAYNDYKNKIPSKSFNIAINRINSYYSSNEVEDAMNFLIRNKYLALVKNESFYFVTSRGEIYHKEIVDKFLNQGTEKVKEEYYRIREDELRSSIIKTNRIQWIAAIMSLLIIFANLYVDYNALQIAKGKFIQEVDSTKLQVQELRNNYAAQKESIELVKKYLLKSEKKDSLMNSNSKSHLK